MPMRIKIEDGHMLPVEDPFTDVADDQDIPQGDVIVSLQRFQAEGEKLLGEGRKVGVRIEASDRVEEILPDIAKISGCINACGHHHVGHIGILGVDKKGEEFYQVTLGGSGEDDAALGQMLGPALPAAKVAEAVEQMVEVYMRERKNGERFLDTFRRTGVAPFKEAVYADAH